LAIGLVAENEAILTIEDHEAFADAVERIAQQIVRAFGTLARFHQLGLVGDGAAIADEGAVVVEDGLAVDADVEAADRRQADAEAEVAERLMGVEIRLVLAPFLVDIGIAAGLLPARLADEIDLRPPGAGDHGEAMLGIGLPDPVAADLDDV